MTLTIELDSEQERQLKEKAAREGREANQVARQMLGEALAWEAQDYLETLEGINRGLEDVEAGRERPLSDVVAEHHRKYNYSESRSK